MKNNVKKLRLEHKMKQEDIGELISKSQQSVSRLENEQRDIDIYELCLLVDYFDVSTDFILGRTSIRSTPESSNIYEKLIIDNYSILKGLNDLELDEKAIISTILANCVNLVNLLYIIKQEIHITLCYY